MSKSERAFAEMAGCSKMSFVGCGRKSDALRKNQLMSKEVSIRIVIKCNGPISGRKHCLSLPPGAEKRGDKKFSFRSQTMATFFSWMTRLV